MPRAKRGTKARQRRKKILRRAKGYRGMKSKAHSIATEAVDKGLKYAYRDRKARKREFRSLWIVRINAGARLNGLSYSQLMNGLKRARIEIDRKTLADLAVRDAPAFARVAQEALAALA